MKIFGNPCKKRDRKATEEAILSAASKLFAEKGYESTRTLDIAKEARANEALIGRYFGGKEGLLVALMKERAAMKHVKDIESCAALDRFPSADDAKNLKDAILTFFKNGNRALGIKEQFARIACSRAMVDPEMADVIRTHIIDENLPQMVAQLKTHFQDKKVKKADLEALAFLLMSVNFNLNFMARKIHKIENERIDDAFAMLAATIQAWHARE
jgi:AcrR family transcriptional regulator